MTKDELVNLGHLIAWLEPGQFDQIPWQLLVENLEEFRDSLEEQKMHKGFTAAVKNITTKIVVQLGWVEEFTSIQTECHQSLSTLQRTNYNYVE